MILPKVLVDLIYSFLCDFKLRNTDGDEKFYNNGDDIKMKKVVEIIIYNILIVDERVKKQLFYKNRKILKIVGPVKCVGDMSGIFEWSIINSKIKLDTSEVTNMSRMFSYSKFNQPIEMDTSLVTNMFAMFAYSEFNHPIVLNTKSVTIMRSMFAHSVFNHPIILNTSEVTDMSCMFTRSVFNQPIELNTKKVYDMTCMFAESKFKQPITLYITEDTLLKKIFHGTKININIKYIKI